MKEWGSSIIWFVKIGNMEKCRDGVEERGVVDHSRWLGLVSATLCANCSKSNKQCLTGPVTCTLLYEPGLHFGFCFTSDSQIMSSGAKAYKPMMLLSRPTQERRGQMSCDGNDLSQGTWAGLGWDGCGSLLGSPRPTGRQQPCLVLECMELC